MHDKLRQKPVQLDFLIFASNFLWILNYKKREFCWFLAIGSLSFHPIFPIFGFNVHNNIAHKIVQPEFLFLPEASIGLRVHTKFRHMRYVLFGESLEKH